MKPFNKTSVSFGRHETFSLRFGWITKGFKGLSQDPGIFESDHATVILGVGKNMVHAIRYWLIASQVIEANGQSLVMTPLGKLIYASAAASTWPELRMPVPIHAPYCRSVRPSS